MGLSHLYQHTIVEPLRKLYFAGPTQLGGWGGSTESAICQQLSPLPNAFWELHVDECSDLLQLKFDAFRVTVEVVLYFCVLYYLVKLLVMSPLAVWRQLRQPKPRLVPAGSYLLLEAG